MESNEPENAVVPTLEPKNAPKLFDLCLVPAAEEIRKLSNGPNFQSTPMLSQKLFEMIHIPHEPIPRELLLHLQQKLKIHNIVLGTNNMNEKHRDFVYAQRIESLVLLDPKDGRMYVKKNGPKAGKKRKGRPHRVNIVGCLRRFLNPESRRVLTSLSIVGNLLTFQQGWTKEVQELLPAIKNFDISGCCVNNEELTTLCESGLLLNSLSIARTEVNCLNGIEIQSGLKVLVLEDLKFKTPEELQSLFQLQQLEVLYFSCLEGLSNKAELLSKCEGTLPKLKFLDISGNIVSEATVNRLLTQFPKLEEMAVILTNFDKHLGPNPFVRDIKLYGLKDLGACVESLGLYISHSAWCMLLMREITNLVYYDIDNQNKEDLLNCVKKLIGIVESRFQHLDNRVLAVRCLTSADKKNVIKMMPVEQRTRLVYALCNTIRTAQWMSDDFFFTLPYGFAAEVTDFFDKTDVMAGTNLEQLACDTLVQLIQRVSGLCQFFLVPCYSFLAKHQDLISNMDTLTRIQMKMSVHNFLMKWTNGRVFLCCKVLKFLAVVLQFGNTNNVVDYNLVVDIFRVLNTFNENEIITELGFQCLELLFPNLDHHSRQYIFHPSSFNVITKSLRNRHISVKKAAVKFLLKEHKWNAERENYRPYTPEALDLILSDILLLIDAYGPFEPKYVNVLFAHITITTVDEEIATFGEWVLQHFPEFDMDVPT